jgi:hypothetical protein
MVVALIAYTGARRQDSLEFAFADVGERGHFRPHAVRGQRIPGAKTGADRRRSVETSRSLWRGLLSHYVLPTGATAKSRHPRRRPYSAPPRLQNLRA